MKKALQNIIMLTVILLTASFNSTIEKLSLDFTIKTLQNKKSVTAKGIVYYKPLGGVMITRFTSPNQSMVIANSKGEMKMYSPEENTVLVSRGQDLSTETSTFYYFLTGKMQDMGLKDLGFKLKGTKKTEGMVVTEWISETPEASGVSRVELVHENYLPIFMGFYNQKNKIALKIYYSDFNMAGDLQLPFTVTEIGYSSPLDSTITKKTYTNLKLNKYVEDTYFNFQIPANAKVLK